MEDLTRGLRKMDFVNQDPRRGSSRTKPAQVNLQPLEEGHQEQEQSLRHLKKPPRYSMMDDIEPLPPSPTEGDAGAMRDWGQKFSHATKAFFEESIGAHNHQVESINEIATKVALIDSKLDMVMQAVTGKTSRQYEKSPENPPPTLYNSAPNSPTSPPKVAAAASASHAYQQNDPTMLALLGTAARKQLTDDTAKFKPSDIGYFDPYLSTVTYAKGDYIQIGTDVIYRNVHLFFGQARSVAATKNGQLVRQNLHLCLKGEALAWFAAELDDLQRSGLQTGENVDTWQAALTARFKMHESEAMEMLLTDQYTVDDVRNQRSPSEYVQTIVRHGRDAGLSTSNQLMWAWNRLAPELQLHIKRPTPKISVLSFIEQLNEQKGAWFRYYSSSTMLRPTRYTYGETSHQFATNPLQQPLGTSPQQQQARMYTHEEKEAAYQRGYQANPNRRGPYQNSAGGATRAQIPPQVNAAHGPSALRNQRTLPAPPQRAYHTAYDDEPSGQSEVYFNDSHLINEGLQPWSCDSCDRFGNHEELAMHLLDTHGIDIDRPPTLVQNFNIVPPPDKGYAAVEGSIDGGNIKKENKPEKQENCADSGTGISIFDHDLAIHAYGLAAHRTGVIRLRGIGNGMTSKYVNYLLTLPGIDKPLEMSAYLLKDLACGVLIGNDMLTKHGIDIINSKGVLRFTQHGNVELPITYKSASQIKASNAAKSLPVNHILPSQSASTKATGVHRSSAFHAAIQSTPPPPTHACIHCNFIATSNRMLRRHCSALHKQQQQAPIGQNSDPDSASTSDDDKWTVLGNTRRAA